MIKIRSPSSQYPYPSLETVGNDRAHEGATAHQNMPRSRLPTPPSSVESGRWHDPCRSRRNDGAEHTRSDGRPLLRLGDRACVEPQAGESALRRTGVVTRPPPRRGAREPGTPFGEEVAFRGRWTGPMPHEGILALQRGEDVKCPYSPVSAIVSLCSSAM